MRKYHSDHLANHMANHLAFWLVAVTVGALVDTLPAIAQQYFPNCSDALVDCQNNYIGVFPGGDQTCSLLSCASSASSDGFCNLPGYYGAVFQSQNIYNPDGSLESEGVGELVATCLILPPIGPPNIPSYPPGTQTGTDGSTLGSGMTSNSGGDSANTAGSAAAGGGGSGAPGTPPPGCTGACCASDSSGDGGTGIGGLGGAGGPQQATTAGDPCNISNGAFWHRETPFSLVARTPQTSLTFTRGYVAWAAAPAGGLGPNWRHNWETSLFSGQNGSLIWIDENGGTWVFASNGSGGFVPPLGTQLVLSAFSDHYELKKPNGVRLFFSNGTATGAPAAGLLTQIVDPHGEMDTLSYDSNGNLLSVSNALAGNLTFARNAQGLIASVTRVRDNLTYSYSYTTDGRLQSETDFAGNVTSYTYVTNQMGTFAQGMLASVTDPLGRVTAMSYDSSGRLVSQSEPGNGMRTLAYGGTVSAPVTSVTEVDGQTSVYHFNSQYLLTEADHPDGSKSTQTWTSGNLRSSYSDELGNMRTFAYDANENLSSVTRADGTTTQFSFDPTWNELLSLTPPIGAPSAWTLDAATGDYLSYSRTSTSAGSLALTFTRDAFGNLLATSNGLATYSNQTDPSTGLETFLYDAFNPETLSYDSRNRLIRRSYGSSRIIQYSYDNYDRVIQVTDSNGPTLLNTYDAVGRLLTQTVTDGTTSQKTQFQYDPRDRVSSLTDALGNVTQFLYDTVSPTGTAISPGPVSVTDPNGHTTLFTYDNRDRLSTRRDANGGVTQFSYDPHGNLLSLTDPLGNVSNFQYDVDNRLVEESSPSLLPGKKAGVANPTTAITQYAYDAVDEIVSKTESSSPSGKSSQTSVILESYDPFNRLVEIKQGYQAGSSFNGIDDATFGYQAELDHVSLASANNGIALLGFSRAASPPFSVTAYSQQAADPKNNLKLVQGQYTLSRDASGEISEIMDASGKVLFTASHDPASRLLTIVSGNFMTKPSLPLSSTLSYDTFGRKSGLTDLVGTKPRASAQFQYNLLNRVTSIAWLSGEGKLSLSEELRYDPAGNITSSTREFGELQYGYDPTNQLLSVTASGGKDKSEEKALEALLDQSFQYDLGGNRLKEQEGAGTTKDIESFSYLSNQLVSDSNAAFLSDPNGFGELASEMDIQSGVTESFDYRPDGKLSSYAKTGIGWARGGWDQSCVQNDQAISAVDYLYDALGRRVAKSVTEHQNRGWDTKSTTSFTQTYGYLSDQDKILLASSGDGKMSLYLDGQGMDEHLGKVGPDETKAYVTDHLGSVLDSELAGAYHVYGAFGETTGAVSSLGKGSAPVKYGYTGRQYDPESGEYYYRARTYSPGTGRFLQRDPIGFGGGDTNLYGYVLQDPINAVDSSGTGPFLAAACTVGGAALSGYSAAQLQTYGKQLLTSLQAQLEVLKGFINDPGGDGNSCPLDPNGNTQKAINSLQNSINGLSNALAVGGAALAPFLCGALPTP